MNPTNEVQNHIQFALQLQIDILSKIICTGSDSVAKAASLILRSEHVVTTGIGKSAFIAQKMAASLVSIGIDARFLHPTDALHGDIGRQRESTVFVVFSKSGRTDELLTLADMPQVDCANRVVVSSSTKTPLCRKQDVLVHVPVDAEYDHDNLLPTASTTASLAVADVIVSSVALQLTSSAQILTTTHPQGSIGRLLRGTVADLLAELPEPPMVFVPCSVRDAVTVLHEHARGIVCGVDAQGKLVGILTDGDIRRLVRAECDMATEQFLNVATLHPVTISPLESLHQAMQLMERRSSKLAVLPVVESENKLVGVLQIHDIVSHSSEWR